MAQRILLIFLLATGIQAFAQKNSGAGAKTTTNADTMKNDSKKSFVAELDYGTNTVFMGKQQDQKYPYWSPSLSYETKGGFWVSATAYKLVDVSGINEFDAGLGYDFDMSQYWTGTVSFSHYVFNKKSPILKSSLKNDLGFSVERETKVINLGAGLDYYIGTKNDLYLNLSGYHTFSWYPSDANDNELALEPRITLLMGSQNYTTVNQQDLTRQGKLKKKGAGGTTSTSSFNLVDYQLTLPLRYTIGKCTLEAQWNYAVPTNVPEGISSAAVSYFIFDTFFTFK